MKKPEYIVITYENKNIYIKKFTDLLSAYYYCEIAECRFNCYRELYSATCLKICSSIGGKK